MPRDAIASTAQDEWQTFQQLGELANHWDRPGWTERTRSYHWFITFESAHDLHNLAIRCQSHLADISTLDAVPVDDLHATVERAGFADEVSVTDARRISDAAVSRCR